MKNRFKIVIELVTKGLLSTALMIPFLAALADDPSEFWDEQDNPSDTRTSLGLKEERSASNRGVILIPFSSISQNTSRYTFGEPKRDCQVGIQRLLRGLEESVSSSKIFQTINGPTQYSCKEVVFDVTTIFMDESYGSWPSRHQLFYNMSVQAFCVPRTMSEKQLYSFAQKCEREPTELCFRPDILKKIDTISNTRFSYSGIAQACQ